MAQAEGFSAISASAGPSLSPLLGELIEAKRLARRPDIARLVPARVRGGGVIWGFARVEADERYYMPSPDGRTVALIAPAYERRGNCTYIVDLVATSISTRAVRRRRGEAAILGDDWIDCAIEARRPVRLYENPLWWVNGRCHGAVVLDWRDLAYRLAEASSIICQTTTLAERVSDAFARPIPMPPLYVPPAQETRHAA
ncbi:MAG TPA: hypothetical protein VFB13_12515 [Reyranella sp.]|jgi:hypothetical protein|nr:hypothetical protein [Reyranella sp.]